MAISQAMVTSFKKALLDGEMDFSSNTSQTFKIALFTSSATLGAATTAYSTTNEVSGTGYTAGGNTLTVVAPTTSGTTALLDFANTTWSTATITARGALIYQVWRRLIPLWRFLILELTRHQQRVILLSNSLLLMRLTPSYE